MQNIVEIVDAKIKDFKIQTGDVIVVAVSGGVDSVTLLDILTKMHSRLIVAHFDHGVRLGSEDDQKFVHELAKKYNLPFVTKKNQTPNKGNLEEDLRNKRREFLTNVAKRHNAKYIALGHNKNDQVETFIFNLLRGSGPNGLSAMNEISGNIIRPLLGISRSDIELYAEANGLTWREDPTNQDITFSRNYIRHVLLPDLEKRQSDILDVLYETTRLQKSVDTHLKNEAKKHLDDDIAKLSKLDSGVLFEVFAQNFEHVSGSRRDFSLANYNDLAELIASSSGTKSIDLPQGVVAKRRYSTLEFLSKKEDNVKPISSEINLEMGRITFGDWCISTEAVTENKSKNEKDSIYIPKAIIEDIAIRPKRNGDKIQNLTNGGSKKLQDLFTDAKIDKDERSHWPIFTGKDGEILWVPGLAIAKNIKLSDNSTVKITARKAMNEK